MTHHFPGLGTRPVPTTAVSLPTIARLDREALRFGIALRRERLAESEAELVAGCEAAAHHGEAGTSARTTAALGPLHMAARYLAASARLEGCYGPRMRRLRENIARLERLLDLPVAA